MDRSRFSIWYDLLFGQNFSFNLLCFQDALSESDRTVVQGGGISVCKYTSEGKVLLTGGMNGEVVVAFLNAAADGSSDEATTVGMHKAVALSGGHGCVDSIEVPMSCPLHAL